jgi:hypothetical protein
MFTRPGEKVESRKVEGPSIKSSRSDLSNSIRGKKKDQSEKESGGQLVCILHSLSELLTEDI